MMKQRSRKELLKEIQRVENAIEKTNSDYLKKDYGKYLKKLKRELKWGGYNCKLSNTKRAN